MLITQFLRSLALLFFLPTHFSSAAFRTFSVHRRIERSNNAVLDEAKNKNDICI